MKLLNKIDDFLRLKVMKEEFTSKKFINFLIILNGKKLLKSNIDIFKKRYLYFEEFKHLVLNPSELKKLKYRNNK